MDEFEKRSRFEQAFQRGQEGDVSSFEAWLQDRGFDPNRLNHQYLTQYFQQRPEEAPNHDNQLEEIAEFIGFFSRRDGIYHTPVIGVSDIGKSQFLHTVSYLLDRLDAGVPHRYYSAADFVEQGEEEQYFYEVIDELVQLEKAVICIDDSGEDKRIEHSLQKIGDSIEDVFIITAWTPERWRWHQEQVNESIRVSKEIELDPLSEKSSIAALRKAVEVYSSDGTDVPNSIYKRVHEVSYGVPGILHRILRETLEETFHRKLKLGNTAAVDAAVEKLNLENAQDRIYNISDKKLTILKFILLARHPKGRRPTELVDRLDKDKSTISYHLQTLVSDKILQKERNGRSTFYRVRDPIKPLVQLRLTKEGEFYD